LSEEDELSHTITDGADHWFVLAEQVKGHLE